LTNSILQHLAVLQQEPHFITSAVIDPRYRLKWIKDPALKENYKELVLQHMNQNQHVYSGKEVNLLTVNESSGGSDIDELLSFMCKDHEQDDRSPVVNSPCT
jgi:hypothetical protein